MEIEKAFEKTVIKIANIIDFQNFRKITLERSVYFETVFFRCTYEIFKEKGYKFFHYCNGEKSFYPTSVKMSFEKEITVSKFKKMIDKI